MQHHRLGLTSAMLYNIDDPTDLLKLIIVFQAGVVPVYAVPYGAEWGEVDSADDLAAYQ